jgi:hypothetical protein
LSAPLPSLSLPVSSSPPWRRQHCCCCRCCCRCCHRHRRHHRRHHLPCQAAAAALPPRCCCTAQRCLAAAMLLPPSKCSKWNSFTHFPGTTVQGMYLTSNTVAGVGYSTILYEVGMQLKIPTRRGGMGLKVCSNRGTCLNMQNQVRGRV